MKKSNTMTGVFMMLIIFSILALPNNTVFAESNSDFLFSAQSNSSWILKKSTRKLIFLQFQNPQKTWKSNPVVVSPDFNLNECVLTSVGSRGTSVFLHDKSSGLITFFDVRSDHTVVSYLFVDINKDLK